ncbi:MAG: hypothetical protein HY722_06520 [Planctomycetes bacterium]|nr:hypothetical protein [Planctomycetota bacterium]
MRPMARRGLLVVALVLAPVLATGAYAYAHRRELAASALERLGGQLLDRAALDEVRKEAARARLARLAGAIRSGRLTGTDLPRLREVDRALQEASRDRRFDPEEVDGVLARLDALLADMEARP